jgi:hypothetical protein
MAHANFLWGAPRIHGELLKLGITVSQATVSRHMPPSRKDRRSQAWRTFIRNHGNAIAQSRSFKGYNWTRDLLSQTQVGSQSRVFTYRLSALVVVPIADPPCWAVCHTAHPLPVAVTRPGVGFMRNATLTAKSTALAAGSSRGRSFDDRSNSRPTHHTEAETLRGPFVDALNRQARVSSASNSAP